MCLMSPMQIVLFAQQYACETVYSWDFNNNYLSLHRFLASNCMLSHNIVLFSLVLAATANVPCQRSVLQWKWSDPTTAGSCWSADSALHVLCGPAEEVSKPQFLEIMYCMYEVMLICLYNNYTSPRHQLWNTYIIVNFSIMWICFSVWWSLLRDVVLCVVTYCL